MSWEHRTADNPVRGVLGVIQQDGRLLMIQRSAHVRVPLAWCFPGGTVEEGETQEEALVREMCEELSVAVEPGRLLTTQTKHHGRLVLYCWSAAIIQGAPSPNPKEVATCSWLTPSEIQGLPGLLPGTMEIISAVGL